MSRRDLQPGQRHPYWPEWRYDGSGFVPAAPLRQATPADLAALAKQLGKRTDKGT